MRWDLNRLLSPTDAEDFVAHFWEKAHFRVHRTDPGYFEDLFTLADLDDILAHTGLWTPGIRLLRDGKEFPLARLQLRALLPSQPSLDALYSEFVKGATIAMHFLQERSGPLASLCQHLQHELSGSVQVNAYITPPGERGLPPHHDDHDVFVVQIHGSKHWSIFEGGPPLPLKGESFGPSGSDPVERDAFDVYAGDVLYIPRGVLHAAQAKESVSVHLTVGVTTVTWADVFLLECERLLRASPQARTSLPGGFATDDSVRAVAVSRFAKELEAILARVDATKAIDAAAEQVTAIDRGDLSRHLLGLCHLPALTPDTELTVRDQVRVTDGNGHVLVQRYGKAVRLPHRVAPVIDQIRTASRFSARQLVSLDDDESRLVLVRCLLREGIIELAAGGREAGR